MDIYTSINMFLHEYIHPIHRVAVNTNQWVQCTELQAKKVFKSIPSRLRGVNLRVHHIARAISK